MSDLPAWIAPLIGTPFVDHGRSAEGYDCWGLAREAWRHYGIEVPSYTEQYVTTEDREHLALVFAAELPQTPWREIPVSQTQPGDGLLFRVAGSPLHVGVVVAPGRFLHTDRKTGAVVDRLVAPRWQARLLGAYRYEF